jgi:hypothetical protein
MHMTEQLATDFQAAKNAVDVFISRIEGNSEKRLELSKRLPDHFYFQIVDGLQRASTLLGMALTITELTENNSAPASADMSQSLAQDIADLRKAAGNFLVQMTTDETTETALVTTLSAGSYDHLRQDLHGAYVTLNVVQSSLNFQVAAAAPAEPE